MKRALVFQHMNYDHPGRFLDFFAEDNMVPHAVRLWEGQAIPPLHGFDFLFVLGGAQDTWQEAEHPWLMAEKQAIREWVVERSKPYFGVCLGHQLLCDALGGTVAPAQEAEVGVCTVSITPVGRDNALLSGVPAEHKVMQWHWAEVKAVPPGVAVLAASERSAVQVAAYGDHAVGTQFHCEFTPQTMATWASIPSYISSLESAGGPGAYERVVAEATPLMPEMGRITRQIYDNLARASGFRG
jgi:GMP synthase-like glutamine amidotransferase